MVTPSPVGESSPRLGHAPGETFTVPAYTGSAENRKITGEHTFTVGDSDGHSVTVSSETGGTYTMKPDAVKHFSDDLNQRVDVPQHPSHQGINAIREGRAQFLGKGDDGLAFATGDGKVTKVSTSVPYNLAYFREHEHAIADARRQAELTNQAIADGHDVLLPQEFTQHGEKGFTTMQQLDLDAELSREQIIDYRNKMRALTESGWRIGDDVQTGVDDQGNIRIYDTGKLTRTTPGDDDSWQQDRHPGKLLREHGHYDDETLDNELKTNLQHFEWAATDPNYAEHLAGETQKVSLNLQTMIEHDHDAAPFVIDDVREVLEKIPDSEHKQEIATLIDFWESDQLNDVMDTRMLDAQVAFADLVTEYEGIDDDDEPHKESLDEHITNKDLFGQMVEDLSPEQLGMLGFKAYESWGDDINLAGFAMDADVLHSAGDEGRAMREIAELQESLGLNLQGEELHPGQTTSDGGKYEPAQEPDMDTFMRNQYPEGYSLGPAGFIMADGALLDMSQGGGEVRGDDHRSIIPTEEAAQRWDWAMDGQGDSGEGSTSRWGLLVQTLARSGAIRFDPSGLLHLEKEATTEQERVIANYIRDYEPDYMSIRFGNGQNDAIQEWDVDNPTAGQVIEQLRKAAIGERVNEPTEWQMVPRDEWPDQHTQAYMNGGSFGYIDLDDYLGAIPHATLRALEETLESEIDDKEWSMRQGYEFPPLLFYKNRKNAESVATALAAQRIGWQSIPVISEPDHRPEYEAPDTPEFATWFGNSKVVNADGTPKPYMHGTTADDDLQLFETMRGSDIGAHFGDLSQAAQFTETQRAIGNQYHDNARIMPVWLSIQNPLTTDDLGRWDVDEITSYMEEDLEAKGIPWPEFISDEEVPDRGDWNDEVMDLVPEVSNEHAWFNNYHGAWEKFKKRKNWILLRDALEEAGYDGIAYNNIYEGEGDDNQAFIALRPEQIKSVTGNSGAFDRNDPRIRYAADDMEGYEPPKPGQEFAKAMGVQTEIADPETVADRSETRMDYEESDGAAVRAEHLEPYEHVAPEPVPKIEKNPESLKWLASKFEEYDKSPKDPLGQLLKTDDLTPQQQENWTNNMARLGYNALKNYEGEGASQLFKQAEKHYELAFPEQPKQLTGWEDDDYLYHIAPVSVADAVAKQGLKPNQSSNFDSNLEFNIKGNVFLTEKSGVEEWQRMVGQGAGSRLDQELAKQERRVMEMEASAEEFENDWGDAVWDESEPWVTSSWEQMQADLAEATETRDRMEEMRNNLEHDYEDHTRVFRVPKKHIQGVAATDELGSQDATGKAYKINNWVSSQVRHAKEQIGVVQKQMSDSQKTIRGLDTEKKQLQDNTIAANARLNDSYNVLAEQVRLTRQNISETAPATKELEYTAKVGQNEIGEKESQLYMQNPFTGESVLVFSMPYDPYDHQNDAKSLTMIFKNLIFNVHDLEDPVLIGDQPMDQGKQVATIHWPDSAASQFGSQDEGREYLWIPEGHNALHEWAFRDWNEWRENNVAMDQLNGLVAVLETNLPDAYMPGKGVEGDRDRNFRAELQDMIQVEAAPEMRSLMASLSQVADNYDAAHDAKEAAEQWEGINGEQYNANLTTLARGQLRDLQLKVASNPNYWQWGRDNYAVDDEGLPLIIFHGTTEGGFNDFTRFDVGEHIYGSTSVRTGSTYTGGWTDDITPCFATSVDDIERTLRSSKEFRLAEYGDGFAVHARLDSSDQVLTATTPEELVVKWNRWIGDNTAGLRTSGVYPLVYRLTNPMIVDGRGENWNRIPLMPETSDEIWDSPIMQSLMQKRADRMDDPLRGPEMTKHQRQITGVLQTTAASYLFDILEGQNNYEELFDSYEAVDIARDQFQKNMANAAETVGNMRGMSATFPQTLMRALVKTMEKLPERSPGLQDQYEQAYAEGNMPAAERVQEHMLQEENAREGYAAIFADRDAVLRKLVKIIYEIPWDATTRDLANLAEESGFDGVVFRDLRDHGGKGGEDIDHGDLEPADVFVAFTRRQVKSAHAPEFAEIGEQAGKFVYSAVS